MPFDAVGTVFDHATGGGRGGIAPIELGFERVAVAEQEQAGADQLCGRPARGASLDEFTPDEGCQRDDHQEHPQPK